MYIVKITKTPIFKLEILLYLYCLKKIALTFQILTKDYKRFRPLNNCFYFLFLSVTDPNLLMPNNKKHNKENEKDNFKVICHECSVYMKMKRNSYPLKQSCDS